MKYTGFIFFGSFLILGIVSFFAALSSQAYVASFIALLIVIGMIIAIINEIKDFKWM